MWGAIIGGAISAMQNDSAGGKASGQADALAGLSGEQRQRATQLWNDWQNTYQPLRRHVIDSTFEGTTPRYEQVARMAHVDVQNAFDNARQQAERNMGRYGIRDPSGDAAQAMERNMQIKRAAADAAGQTLARERETKRVQDRNDLQTSRQMQLLGMGQQDRAMSNNLLTGSASTGATAGGIYSNIHQNNLRSAGNIGQGFGYVVQKGIDNYNKNNTNDTGSSTPKYATGGIMGDGDQGPAAQASQAAAGTGAAPGEKWPFEMSPMHWRSVADRGHPIPKPVRSWVSRHGWPDMTDANGMHYSTGGKVDTEEKNEPSDNASEEQAENRPSLGTGMAEHAAKDVESHYDRQRRMMANIMAGRDPNDNGDQGRHQQGQHYAKGGIMGHGEYAPGQWAGEVDADGAHGMIHGPEGNDAVTGVVVDKDGNAQPAHFTNGEYVLPKRTVEALGTKHIDKMVEQTNGVPPGNGRSPVRPAPSPAGGIYG